MNSRFALVHDGTVENVIVADLAFVSNPPDWMRAKYQFVEVITEDETPITRAAVVTRLAEPGGRYDSSTKTFTRASKEPPSDIESRVALLEATLAESRNS